MNLVQNAQQILIGACFRDTITRYQIIEQVNPEDFEDPQLRHLYCCIKEVNQDKENDFSQSRVGSLYVMQSGETLSFFVNLMMLCLDHSFNFDADVHIKFIRERSQRKRLNQLTFSIANMVQKELTPDEIIAKIKEEVSLISLDKTNSVLTANQSMDNHIDGETFETYLSKKMEDVKQGKSIFPGIPYGFPTLDQVTGGIRAGSLVVVGARTSAGKTQLTLNFADRWLTHHVPVGIFSMEMPLYQLNTRLVALRSGLDVSTLEGFIYDPEQQMKIWKSAQWLRQSRLCYDQTPGLTPDKLRSRLYFMKERHGIKVAIVDFLTLMNTDRKVNNSHEKFTFIIQELQCIAKEINLPIVLIAQLNRDSVKDGTSRLPNLSDIRESGAIEECADVAILLHRYDTIDPMNKPGEAELIIDKNRHTGKRCKIKLVYEKRTGRYYEQQKEVHEDLSHLHPFLKE